MNPPFAFLPRILPLRRRAWAAALVLLAAIGGFGFVLLRPRAAPPPLEISLWYWHRPFRIPRADMDRLRGMGVRRLFVHAGTFRLSPTGVQLAMPQQWQGRAPGLEVHLVYNFGYDVVRGFAGLSSDRLADAVWTAADRERARAEAAGVPVSGIQLDFDCPTGRLPKYADLLRRLRAHAAAPASRRLGRIALSITALPTWFGSARLRDVARQVDFLVPQFYEADVPRTRQRFATISSLARFERGLRAAGRLGAPFYAGVPAYGHALVFDTHDRLLGVFHDMGPDEAIRAPGFRLERSFGADARGRPATAATYTGEDLLDFAAPPLQGEGAPYHLVYDVPTPELVARHLALLRRERPANCLGAVLFRYPEPGERETLPLASLRAAVAAAPARPDVRVRVSAASAPWELIETGSTAARPPLELRVTATNAGAAPTFFAADGVTLTLVLDRPGVAEVPPPSRAWDSVDSYYTGTPAAVTGGAAGPRLLPSSLARANVLVFRRACLGPGESLSTGPIRLPADGATHVRGLWTARCPGGFETLRGDVPATDLAPRADGKPEGGVRL